MTRGYFEQDGCDGYELGSGFVMWFSIYYKATWLYNIIGQNDHGKEGACDELTVIG